MPRLATYQRYASALTKGVVEGISTRQKLFIFESRIKTLANTIDTTLDKQQQEIERIGLATRAVIVAYTGATSKDIPIYDSYNPNGQRDEKLSQKIVRVSKADRVNRKNKIRDSVELNQAKMHDVYEISRGSLIGNFIHAFMEVKNAQLAGMDSEMVTRDTFEGIVTRNQNYWGIIPRAMIDKIPLLQWEKHEKYGAVISLSPDGIKWVDDVLQPDRALLQWERVPETNTEQKTQLPRFKYTCMCEIDGKTRAMTIPFMMNSTCHDCDTVWELVTV
jgi:hypothetical protein